MKLRNLTIIIFAIGIVSCQKCKECYLIETVNGNSVETPIGEFCGDEIENQENKEYTPSEGTAHVECRK